MSEKSDNELLRIIHFDREGYQLEAVHAAEYEITKRNLTPEQIVAALNEIEKAKKEKEKRTNEPLAVGWKIVSFLVPGIMQIILSGIFKGDGYDKKARDLTKWTFIGIIFYVILILIITIIN